MTFKWLVATPSLGVAKAHLRSPGGPIDDVPAKHERSRFIAVTLMHSTTLPEVVAYSDLAACIPRTLSCLRAFAAGTQVDDLPFASPRYAFRMVWHDRFLADPANLWRRGQVRQAIPLGR